MALYHLHHATHPLPGTVNPILVRLPEETITDYYYRLLDYWTCMEPYYGADR